MKETYYEVYTCVLKILDTFMNNYNESILKDEILYLIIHINTKNDYCNS